MEIDIKQAIRENWTKTIRAWCKDLGIGKMERQRLERYHMLYVDNIINKRVGQQVFEGRRAPWILTYNEFNLLQEYRAKRANIGRPKGSLNKKR